MTREFPTVFLPFIRTCGKTVDPAVLSASPGRRHLAKNQTKRAAARKDKLKRPQSLYRRYHGYRDARGCVVFRTQSCQWSRTPSFWRDFCNLCYALSRVSRKLVGIRAKIRAFRAKIGAFCFTTDDVATGIPRNPICFATWPHNSDDETDPSREPRTGCARDQLVAPATNVYPQPPLRSRRPRASLPYP